MQRLVFKLAWDIDGAVVHSIVRGEKFVLPEKQIDFENT